MRHTELYSQQVLVQRVGLSVKAFVPSTQHLRWKTVKVRKEDFQDSLKEAEAVGLMFSTH